MKLSKTSEPPDLISQASIGRQRLLKAEDVAKIVEKTGLSLDEGINEGAFYYWLNHIVESTLREQLRERLSRKHLSQLNSSLETYNALSRSLLHDEVPPPLLPPDWVSDAENWMTEARSLLDARKSGGAAENTETMSFYPRALGLFHAGFGVELDHEVDGENGRKKVAVFTFLEETTKTTRKKIEERGFASTVSEIAADRARWFMPLDDTFKKRISKAKNLSLSSEVRSRPVQDFFGTGDRKQFVIKKEGLAWKLYADQYRDLFQIFD